LLHQCLQQGVFAPRQLHRPAVDAEFAGGDVEAQVAERQHAGGGAAQAPTHGAQPRLQLVHVEGFGEIVVGA
jgi:hypothetical protein